MDVAVSRGTLFTQTGGQLALAQVTVCQPLPSNRFDVEAACLFQRPLIPQFMED